MLIADALSALIYLTAAIDAGDDSVLLILADVLEEMGDPRAAGLRRWICGDYPHWQYDYPAAVRWGVRSPWGRLEIGRDLAARLTGGESAPRTVVRGRYTTEEMGRIYPTRSAAMLALAAALTLKEKL